MLLFYDIFFIKPRKHTVKILFIIWLSGLCVSTLGNSLGSMGWVEKNFLFFQNSIYACVLKHRIVKIPSVHFYCAYLCLPLWTKPHLALKFWTVTKIRLECVRLIQFCPVIQLNRTVKLTRHGIRTIQFFSYNFQVFSSYYIIPPYLVYLIILLCTVLQENLYKSSMLWLP